MLVRFSWTTLIGYCLIQHHATRKLLSVPTVQLAKCGAGRGVASWVALSHVLLQSSSEVQGAQSGVYGRLKKETGSSDVNETAEVKYDFSKQIPHVILIISIIVIVVVVLIGFRLYSATVHVIA